MKKTNLIISFKKTLQFEDGLELAKEWDYKKSENKSYTKDYIISEDPDFEVVLQFYRPRNRPSEINFCFNFYELKNGGRKWLFNGSDIEAEDKRHNDIIGFLADIIHLRNDLPFESLEVVR